MNIIGLLTEEHLMKDMKAIKHLYIYTCLSVPGSFPQAAADFVKAHLPEALRQHLQAYEREKKDSQLSYASILEQRILAIDRDMVEKFSASHEEAGKRKCFRHWTSMTRSLNPFLLF